MRKLKTGKLSPTEVLRLEVPYSPQLARAVWLSAGGSTLAARRALADGCAFNFGGGFHHAAAEALGPSVPYLLVAGLAAGWALVLGRRLPGATASRLG